MTFAIKTDAVTQEWEQDSPFSEEDKDECAREFARHERLRGVTSLDTLKMVIEDSGGFLVTFED